MERAQSQEATEDSHLAEILKGELFLSVVMRGGGDSKGNGRRAKAAGFLAGRILSVTTDPKDHADVARILGMDPTLNSHRVQFVLGKFVAFLVGWGEQRGIY